MSGPILFEQKHRGHIWRLEVITYKGKTFGNWRKWYSDGDDWKPTREGCTMPLERLADLAAGLLAYHGLEVPDGL